MFIFLDIPNITWLILSDLFYKIKSLTSILLVAASTFISCENECRFYAVSYESNFENSYRQSETNRLKSDACDVDVVFSNFLYRQGKVSYVKTMLEFEQ